MKITFFDLVASPYCPPYCPSNRSTSAIDILATCVALRIGGSTLQPMLQEMKNNLRSKRYA